MSQSAFTVVVVLSLAALPGCAQWHANLIAPPIKSDRIQRKADALRDFESKRDFAQLEAALDFWKSDNPERCESLLAALVERRPDFVDARLRLGELLQARGELAQAETHFRAALASEPNRAETHHSLGLLLEASSRTAEAATHLTAAANLDPQNDIYRATRDSLHVGQASGRL